jgi:hypothetical protein
MTALAADRPISKEASQLTKLSLVCLLCACLSDAVHNLLEANKIVAATCESQTMHLYFQRNAIISGGRYAPLPQQRRAMGCN